MKYRLYTVDLNDGVYFKWDYGDLANDPVMTSVLEDSISTDTDHNNDYLLAIL